MIIAALAAMAATAASHADSPLAPGFWRSRGYGYVLEAAPNGVTVYDVTRSSCRQSDFVKPEAFAGAFGAVRPQGAGQVLLQSPDKSIALEQTTFSPAPCLKADAVDPDPARNFAVLWETFDENYPFFRERGVDWNAVKAEYAAKAAALGPGGDPWALFTEILAPFRDAHIHLVDGERRFQSLRAAPGEPKTADLQAGLKAYLSSPAGPLRGGLQEAAFGRLLYGSLGPDAGYIAVMTMGGFAHGPAGWPANTNEEEDAAAASAALRQALDALGDKPALILDLRYNPGGSDAISRVIAGVFADRRRFAYTVKARDGAGFGPAFAAYAEPGPTRFNGRLLVLTGAHTTSAAESLVMRLRVLPQVRVVGQRTQGAHSDVLSKTLPNGWRLDLSNEVYALADGRVYEGVGIPADVSTDAPAAGDRFGRDIAVALAQLRPKPGGASVPP